VTDKGLDKVFVRPADFELKLAVHSSLQSSCSSFSLSWRERQRQHHVAIFSHQNSGQAFGCIRRPADPRVSQVKSSDRHPVGIQHWHTPSHASSTLLLGLGRAQDALAALDKTLSSRREILRSAPRLGDLEKEARQKDLSQSDWPALRSHAAPWHCLHWHFLMNRRGIDCWDVSATLSTE
jgi:hypothetical protein